tara:strand:- start:1324 stop:1569 length:246 start_codon:yes stop_codon:yes gene_type:complete
MEEFVPKNDQVEIIEKQLDTKKGLTDFLDAFKTAVLKKSVVEDKIDKQKVICLFKTMTAIVSHSCPDKVYMREYSDFGPEK